MGVADQFKDKSQQLGEKAKQAADRAKGQPSESDSHGRGRPEAETRRAQQEAQDRLDKDYDA